MGQKRENQLLLPGLWPDYRLAQELRAVSKILDDNPSILDLALHNLCDNANSGQGAPGFSSEQVPRAAILKHRQQLPYSQLAFRLLESQHVRRGQSPLLCAVCAESKYELSRAGKADDSDTSLSDRAGCTENQRAALHGHPWRNRSVRFVAFRSLVIVE